MKFLTSILSRFRSVPVPPPVVEGVVKDFRGLRAIFEEPQQIPEANDVMGLFRISIPDTLTEALCQAHISKIQERLGATPGKMLLVLDIMNTCRTGNPLFNINGTLIKYSLAHSSDGVAIIYEGEALTSEQSPSEQFTHAVDRLHRILEASEGWGEQSISKTLEDFLPRQGSFTALEVATAIRQARRAMLQGHRENNVNVAILLEAPDHMLSEAAFSSGFDFYGTPDLDRALCAQSIGLAYKNPAAAGYPALNACIALPDFVSAIKSNRCLYSSPISYTLSDNPIWLESPLSQVLYASTPEKPSLAGDTAKALNAFVEGEVEQAENLFGSPAHAHKLEAIRLWARFAKEMPIKKQVSHLFGLTGAGKDTLCPLTAVENKRVELHHGWVRSRSEAQ